jgi:hypothetical protein
MAAPRTRFEVRVETLLSPVAVVGLGVPLDPTPVPRNSVYRFRIPADRDLAEVVRRLTERGVELVEIRKRPEPPRRPRTPLPPPAAVADDPVVVPFPGLHVVASPGTPRCARRRRPAVGPEDAG